MSNDIAVIRSLIIYAICLPLAVFLGYMISDPLDRTTDITLGIVLFMLVVPLLLRWYQVWLIALWNATIIFYFLPGQLPGWAPMALLAFGVAVGHYILNRERKFISAGSVGWSLVVLGLVVLVTAKVRGLGLHVLGDATIGGKRYFYIWLAILGYFALVSQPIPPHRRQLYTFLFFIGGATAIIGEAASILGGPFHFLYVLFPLAGGSSIFAESNFGPEKVERFAGLAAMMMAIMYTLLAKFGIEGILDPRRLWRSFLFGAALCLSAFGGYRSNLILIGGTLALVFYFEGLFRSRLLPLAILSLMFLGALTVGFSDKLPLSVQRSLAFLPIKLSSTARISAQASEDWRVDMWKNVLPQIPEYFWMGKGLGMDLKDFSEITSIGGGDSEEGATMAQDYHNGPLSLIIPFGIWGCIAFLWFLWASLRVLCMNYKYGDPELRRINTFLLSYFIARILLFFFIFGGFYGDIFMFAGIIGLGVSLNGGVAEKPLPAAQPRVVFNRFRPLPTMGLIRY